MNTLTTIVGVTGAVVTLYVIGFLSGFVVMHVRRNAALTSRTKSDPCPIDLIRLCESVSKQGQEVNKLATRAERVIDGQLMAAIARLVESVESLMKRIPLTQQLGDPPVTARDRSASPETSQRSDSAGISLARAKRRVTNNNSSSDEQNYPEERRGSARSDYTFERYIAPWSFGAPQPTPADFFKVKCRNISEGGLLFFLADCPEFSTFLIALGSPGNARLMIAEIVHTRTAFLYDCVGYLVGCKFLSRYESQPHESTLTETA